jgi:SAM-dependent methyltransferase
MSRMTVGVVGAIGAVLCGIGVVAWKFAFVLAPLSWTGEPDRLARALALGEGRAVADIGAGAGTLALAMQSVVGPTGRVYATELEPASLAALERRVARERASNVTVVRALPDATNLPDGSCDGAYLRMALHHVSARPTFAASVARTLRPHGRVAVIDFAPGALWFHGPDHGIAVDVVTAAFEGAGLRTRERDDHWGGGLYLVVFERVDAPRAVIDPLVRGR